MEDDELHFGPNGGLIFCMEFLLENLNWLEEAIGDQDGDYILFDCPGQVNPQLSHLSSILGLENFYS